MAVQGRYSTAYEDTAPSGPAFSDADINAYVQANIGNPQAIADAAQQYGVSAADLSRATGYDANTVSNYFGNAGINMFGQPAPQATTPAPITPQAPVVQEPPPQPIYEPPRPVTPDQVTPLVYQPPPSPPPQDPNAVQQRIVEEERQRNQEGGLASLGAGSTRPESLPNYSSPKPVDLGNGTFRTYGGTIIDSQGYPVVTPDEAYKIYTQARQGAAGDAQALLSFTGPYEAATQSSMNKANALQAKAGADALAKIGYTVGPTGEMVRGTRPVTTETTSTTTATTPSSVVLPPPTPPNLPPVPPKETQYGTVTPYTTTQIKDYVSGVMGDAGLTSFEKTNKIMEAAQKAGISQDDLTAMYGKNVVDPYMKDYGAGIKGFITSTLGDKTKSEFDKVTLINQAANKYGLDAAEIAKYSGLNKTGVDQMFTAFDTGLAGIVKNLSAPTVSDLDKTKGALALQSKGITDDQIAKALGGNVTGKDVTDYLAPVKNFGSDLQTLTSDQTKTSYDIQAFLDKAKKDPRIEGLYGLAIDKVQKAVPILGLRDSVSGNGTPEQLAKGYTDFVAAVNADPALKEKYGAQADAIDQVAKMSQRIADEKFGGKLQPHMFQTFIGLDQKTIKDVPKQLGMTESTTQTITDNEGQQQTYTTPGQVKDTKGLEPVYTIIGSGEDQTQQLTGYTKPIKTSAGVTVDAQYDAQGKLTGYSGRDEDKVWPKHRVGISGQWDADGKASPVTRVESPGVLKGMIQDVAALGPVGQLAIMFATNGLGSLAAGALTPTLGATAAKVVSSGLINGAMAEMGGGKFATGFLKGAVGNPVEALTQNLVGQFMPNIDTGNATFNNYLTQALPRLASSTAGALIDKRSVADAGLASLVGTGTNMLAGNLINSAMPDTLTPEMQKMFTGVSGQLLSSLLQDKPIDIQKSIISTVMQNAMSPSKTTAKEKG